MIELGYKDFIADTSSVLSWRRRRPRRISSTSLSAKSVEVLKKPAVVEQLRINGFDVIANGSEGLRRRIATEVPKWHDVIAKAGIKPV